MISAVICAAIMEDPNDPGSWIGDPSVTDIITINQNELDAIGCGSLLGTDADADTSPKAHIVKWTKDETLCLLALYKENQALFADPKKKKKAIWDEIAGGMLVCGFNISASKCEIKFKNLKQSYVKTVDHNNRSGNDRKICPYFDELSEIFGMSPSVTPPSTVLSRQGFTSSSSASSDLDETETKTQACCSQAPKKAINKGKRKVTAVSTNGSLIEVFNEFRKERKEEEMERQIKLREMHAEKMMRFDRLLSLFEKMQ